MKKIAIIGLGLIGGSLAFSLKKAGHYVTGIARQEEVLNKAREASAIDAGSLNLQDISDSDIIFVCTPINLIIPVLEQIAPYLKKGAVVSDVGSSKQEIVAKAEKLMPKGTYFVGGHPMAGKEQTKFEAAEIDLFKDKTWIITETSKTSKKAVEQLEEVILGTGAKMLKLDPKTHDMVVAGISHMPLAIAVSLVNAVASSSDKENMAKCAASGFRDTTRIVSGDPLLGVDMFTTNKKAVLKMIGAFKKSLSKLEKIVKNSDSEGMKIELEKAKEFRDSIF